MYKVWLEVKTEDFMSQSFQRVKRSNIHAKPAITMNEDFKNEFQLVVSSLQRLDSKIDSLRSEIKSDLKLFATKSDLLQLEKKIDHQCTTKDDLRQFATKDDLRQFATKDDLRQFATKDDLRQFATKDDLFGLEERNALRYATKDNLAQTKYDLIKWMFTFWASLVLMLIGLYLRK
ncbi:MAG: hypothetical protein Q8918_03450 [Bacteroidota bacterium]|nr:hypothetical protein [Bacteroidota bacterium]MDP4211117.1 hypothetical protein [Bacteroidota bacterium]MDP4249148.1 hypothetical protein [Bacteroidota bacterium]